MSNKANELDQLSSRLAGLRERLAELDGQIESVKGELGAAILAGKDDAQLEGRLTQLLTRRAGVESALAQGQRERLSLESELAQAERQAAERQAEQLIGQAESAVYSILQQLFQWRGESAEVLKLIDDAASLALRYNLPAMQGRVSVLRSSHPYTAINQYTNMVSANWRNPIYRNSGVVTARYDGE